MNINNLLDVGTYGILSCYKVYPTTIIILYGYRNLQFKLYPSL